MFTRVNRDKIIDNLVNTDLENIPNKSTLPTSGEGNAGDIIFNEADSQFYGHNGLIWVLLSGVAGSQGAQGPQGVQGPQGPGAQGIQGPQGVQGPQGAHGSQGIGVQGAQGSQGAQGAQGVQGPQGTGPQGVQGAQGSQGAQGVQGPQGTGPQGAQGAQGVQGAQGAQGPQGTGSQGAQGAQGAQGLQGVQGAQGTQGIQGAQGTQGIASSYLWYTGDANASPGPYSRIKASGLGVTYSFVGNVNTVTIPAGVDLYSVQIDFYDSVGNTSAGSGTIRFVDGNAGRNTSQIPVGASSADVIVPRLSGIDLAGSPGVFIGNEVFSAVGGKAISFNSLGAPGTSVWNFSTGATASRITIDYL